MIYQKVISNSYEDSTEKIRASQVVFYRAVEALRKFYIKKCLTLSNCYSPGQMKYVLQIFFVLGVFGFTPLHAALTESEFNHAIKTFERSSAKVAKKYLRKQNFIPINGMWEKEITNFSMGATPIRHADGTGHVNIGGWLARFPTATIDSIDFILCHEVGHLAVKSHQYPSERLADDFAIRNCLPIIWGEKLGLDRVTKIAEYAWELRNFHRQRLGYKFDPERCTVRLMQEAAQGINHSTEELGQCEF